MQVSCHDILKAVYTNVKLQTSVNLFSIREQAPRSRLNHSRQIPVHDRQGEVFTAVKPDQMAPQNLHQNIHSTYHPQYKSTKLVYVSMLTKDS